MVRRFCMQPPSSVPAAEHLRLPASARYQVPGGQAEADLQCAGLLTRYKDIAPSNSRRTSHTLTKHRIATRLCYP